MPHNAFVIFNELLDERSANPMEVPDICCAKSGMTLLFMKMTVLADHGIARINDAERHVQPLLIVKSAHVDSSYAIP